MPSTIPLTQRLCVGMPVYNGEQTIEATIRNLLEQTHQKFEIIVYDDGSTDTTPEIVSSLGAEDSRIVLHRADENRGRGFARNKLLELTAGSILAWQDADDGWHPRKLELQLEVLLPLLAQGTRAVVLSTYEVVTQGDAQPQIKRPPGIMDADHVFSNRYKSYHFQLQAAIGEADLFAGAGGFDDAMNWSEDIDLALKLIKSGVLLIGHAGEEPMATYNHSLRRARATMIEESQATLIERFGDFARSKGCDLEKLMSLRNAGYLTQVYIQSERPQKALEVALRALLAIDPDDPEDLERLGPIARTMMAVLRPGGGAGAQPQRPGGGGGGGGGQARPMGGPNAGGGQRS